MNVKTMDPADAIEFLARAAFAIDQLYGLDEQDARSMIQRITVCANSIAESCNIPIETMENYQQIVYSDTPVVECKPLTQSELNGKRIGLAAFMLATDPDNEGFKNARDTLATLQEMSRS